MAKDTSLPYLPLYPKDFLGDTGSLSASKFGAYTRLLYTSWFEPLCNDMEDLVEITRVSDTVTAKILERYFELVNGVWINHRLEDERVISNKRHQAAIDRGVAGAEKRWSNDSPTNSSTIDSPLDEGMLTQNSELRTHNTETQSLELKEILSYFPDSFFHDMTIPNLLLNVSKDHGNDALRAICEKVNTITDPKKRTASYVRGIIKNMDLAGIAKGTVSKQGDKLEWFTRLQCAQMAEKSNNGKTTDEMFRALKDGKGNNIKFQEGDRYEGQPVWVKKG